MKKILWIGIFLCSITQALAITEPVPEDFNAWYAKSAAIHFSESNDAVDTNFIYQDNILKAYISQALSANYSIKVAQDRILQYQSLAKGVNSLRLPWLSVSPQANTQRNMSTNSGKYTATGYYNLPMELSWELDIWGKNSLKYKSAKISAAAKKQELDMVKLTVVNDISSSYYNLILTDYLISNAENRVVNLEETIRLKESLYRNGIINFDDIYLTKYEHSQTLEELNQYKIQKEIFIHQIYVLMGKVPENTLAHSEFCELSIPQNMLIQNAELLMFSRPDVQIAQSELEKAHIDVKVAQREFLPTLYLNELIGLSSLNFSDLFNWYSRIYQFGGQLVADLYTGGYKKSNLNYNRQILKEKMHNYYSVLLNSIKETQDILSTMNNDYASYIAYKKVLLDSQNYEKVVATRYASGISSQIDYLDAKRQVDINSKYLNIYASKILVDTANLNKCLGRMPE